jgi:hypothetical protein
MFVYKLNKAIFRLKQAQQVWNAKIDDIFKKNHFIRCQSNYSIYIKSKGTKEVMFLALYVNNLFSLVEIYKH